MSICLYQLCGGVLAGRSSFPGTPLGPLRSMPFRFWWLGWRDGVKCNLLEQTWQKLWCISSLISCEVVGTKSCWEGLFTVLLGAVQLPNPGCYFLFTTYAALRKILTQTLCRSLWCGFFGLAPMASFVRLCLACMLSCALAGRNGGRGHRQPAYGGTADVANPRPGPQVVRLEVAVCDKATRGDGSRERRRQDHHDHGQGRRSRRSDEAPFSHAATTRDKRRRTHKKKKKRSSSSSSTSSSSSSSHAKKQKRNVKLQAAKKKTSWLKKSKSFVNPWNSIRKPRLRSRPVTVGCSWRRRDSHIWRLFALSFMRGSLPNWLMWRLFTPGQMWKSSCKLRLFLCWKSICRPGASPMTSLAGRRLPSPRLFPSFEMLFRAEVEGSGTMWWFLWRWFAHAGFWCGLTRAHWPVRCCRKPFLVGTDGWMLHGPCRFESGVSRHWLIRLLAATFYNSWVEWV